MGIFGMCPVTGFEGKQPWPLANSSAVYTPLSANITETSDIMNGNVTVKLTALSGTTGDVFLNLYGVQNFNTYSKQFSSLGPGSQNLELDFNYVQPDIYKTADGEWYAGANGSAPVIMPTYTLPTPWTYFRKIFYTQYNVPHEDQCSGGNGEAWIVDSNCNFSEIKADSKYPLNADFIQAVWLNGTGVSEHYGILKNAVAVGLGSASGTCAAMYKKHPGAIGQTPMGGNTFAVVSSVTGSCGSTLEADQSLAKPVVQVGNQYLPFTLSGVVALSCSDQLNLDDENYSTAFTRTVADSCPACSKSSMFNGADGHIDAFSSNMSCTGKSVGSLGFFYTSYPTN
jgi:hypothetical protein